MKKWLLLFFIPVTAIRCSHTQQQPSLTEGTANEDSVKTSFFPVTSFLLGQMLQLDSMQVTILQITSSNNKADSAWLPKEKIRPQLQPFVSELIDKENLVPYFKESRFSDQTTEAITFTYDPKTALPGSIALRHWDVYVDPEKGTIKRVYIVKELKGENSNITQQLTWQTGKWAKIVAIDNKSGSVQSDIKWVWNFNE